MRSEIVQRHLKSLRSDLEIQQWRLQLAQCRLEAPQRQVGAFE
jgi:hypothetical protein